MPTAERVRELIDQVDAEAPDLSDEQADAIAALLTGREAAAPRAPRYMIA
jgi:hypothetical protein